MITKNTEKTLTNLLSIGPLLVTIFLWMSGLTDPVNATKLALLGGMGIATLGLLFAFYRAYIVRELRVYLGVFVFFLIAMSNAVIQSNSPLSQNYFGVFGRNTGYLTYFLLSIIAIGAMVLTSEKSFRRIIIAFLAAGIVNTIYSAWVLILGDPLKWDNPYGNILGTFGNPDFVSAFLGMFFAALISIVFAPKILTKYRIFSLVLSIVVLVEIKKSHAIQGLVVAAVGIAVVIFFWLWSKIKSQLLIGMYSLFILLLGILAIAGALQKGPFTFLYKKSVSLRGSYWQAAWDMGNSKPLTGVGLDSYIDNYRRFRPARALVDTPGIDVTSNASHNVFLDFFASGGYPLVVSYIFIVAIGVIAIVKRIKSSQDFDWVFVSVASVWAGYQVQSIVSINQIGLAVWGWLLTGLLVACSKAKKLSKEVDEVLQRSRHKISAKTASTKEIFSPQLVSGVGLVLGLIIASAPLSADSKWFTAIYSKNYSNFEKSLTPGIFNPQNSFKYGQAINLIQNSQLIDQSYIYAKAAVEYNPEFFEAWKQLYYQPKATESDKTEALAKMKSLDPLNPDVTANQ
jgi:O-antigen ligase